ncbi:MAG TPA: CheR family methyltransferase [Actinomycetes bacterium]|nr:CheR family methyltransferase [Actinomycetes bacterium]
MDPGQIDAAFEGLLDLLRQARGVDFSGYKRRTLERRVRRRLQALGLDTYAEYVDHLELHPEEYTELFDLVLINVTSFFRDPAAWEALRDTAIPELLASSGPNHPIRVWSAGCATGQEAYSLAILLAEAMGFDAFRDRAKIYATDVDEAALQIARTAIYDKRELESLPDGLLDTYFEPASDGRWSFRRDLRRAVIFGRNDLTQDAPISRVDLLTSRNTLMYFTADTQEQVLRRFHFALNDGGYLLLGRAEMLLGRADILHPVSLRNRLFRKAPHTGRRDVGLPIEEWEVRTPSSGGRILTAALDASPVAQIVIDSGGRLAVANSRAKSMLNVRPADVGRPFHDLEISYRPIELRSLIDRVRSERRPVELREVATMRPGTTEPLYLDVDVTPLTNGQGEAIEVAVTFVDVSRNQHVREELERANQELEHAYQELHSANEELETTNEELQSTIEELETTNEELQSTNEELETMNEELQSTNEELHTINQSLLSRTDELESTRGLLDGVLSSLGHAVILLYPDLDVRMWGPGAEELWGIRSDEAESRPFSSLDIGLPVAEITPQLETLAAKGEGRIVIESDAVNRRGKAIRIGLSAAVLANSTDAGGIVITIDILDPTEPGPPG